MTTTVSPGGQVVRGCLVAFSSVPIDVDGAPVTPSSVSLNLSYIDGATGLPVLSAAAMSPTGSEWDAIFDTGLAAPCIVEWAVMAADPFCADEGFFEIVANRANLAS